MPGWDVLTWSGACAIGVLAFLKAVANEVERAQQTLRRFEQAQRIAALKRQARRVNTETDAAAAA